jgi:hypothetical protein
MSWPEGPLAFAAIGIALALGVVPHKLASMAPNGYELARTWSRISGGLFLVVDAWLLLFYVTAGGVGLDVRPIVFPWLPVLTLLAGWLLVSRRLRVILPLAVIAGLASAVFWGGLVFRFTYPLIAITFVVFSLTAALTAIQSWQKFRADSPLSPARGASDR